MAKNWLKDAKRGDKIVFGPCNDSRRGKDAIEGVVICVKRKFAYVILSHELEKYEKLPHMHHKVELELSPPFTSGSDSYSYSRRVYRDWEEYRENLLKVKYTRLIADIRHSGQLQEIPLEDLKEVCRLLKLELKEDEVN